MVIITSALEPQTRYTVDYDELADSDDTFKVRLAQKIGTTLPQYLSTSPDKTSYFDLVDYIKKNENLTFDAVVKKVYGPEVQLTLPRDELAKVYLTFVRFSQDSPAFRVMIGSSVGDAVADGTKFLNENNLQLRREKTSSFYDLLTQKIKENSRTAEIDQQRMDKWIGSRAVDSTQIEITSKFVWIPLNKFNVLLEEFFNDFKPDENVIFATIKGIYKMSSSVREMPQPWQQESSATRIQFKVGSIDEVEDIYVRNQIQEDGRFELQMGYLSIGKDEESNFISYFEMLKSCLTRFRDIRSSYDRKVEDDLSLYFIVPKLDFDVPIFKDLAVTNPLVRHYFTIKEQTSFKPGYKLLRTVFAVPEDPGLGRFQVDLKHHKMTPTDRFVLPFVTSDRDREKVDDMPYYLLVKIDHVDSVRTAEKIISVIKRVLGEYQEQQQDVKDLYNAFGVRIEKPRDEEEQDNSQAILKRFYILQSKYFTPIVKPVPFRVLNMHEADWKNLETGELKTTGTIKYNDGNEDIAVHFVRFPPGPEGFIFSAYDFDKNAYISKKDEKFVGFRKNSQRNKNVYPILPIAKSKEDSRLFDIYLGKEVQEAVPVKHTRAIQGTAFIDPTQTAYIPAEINNILKLILNDDSIEMFMRKGVASTESSLLECLLLVKDPVNIKQTTEYIDERRAELPMPDATSLQSNYNQSLTEVHEAIKNPSVYMNPELYMEYLSRHFKLNIVTVRRNKDNTFEFIRPRSQWVLYEPYRPYDEGVIIYEHFGGPSDFERKCEIIFAKTTLSNEMKKFPIFMFGRLLDVVNKTFVYPNDTAIGLDEVFENRVTHQYIDTSGKVRGVVVGQRFALLTKPSPICPGAAIIPYSNFVEALEKNNIPELLEYFGIMEDSGEFERAGQTFKYQIKTSMKPVSRVDQFKAQRRLAQFYKVLCLWAFGNHINDTVPNAATMIQGTRVQDVYINQTHPSLFINFESVLKWVDNHIKVDENTKNYKIVSCKLSKRSLLWDGTTIFVPDEKAQQGLIYYLVLMVQRRPDHVWKMREATWASDVFETFADFDQQPNTLLGDLRTAPIRPQNDYELLDHIVPDKDMYIQNLQIENGSVCRIIHGSNKNHALAIAKFEKDHNAIVPHIDESFAPAEYKIYLYNSASSITLQATSREANLPTIITYKYNERLHYAAVIPVIVEKF